MMNNWDLYDMITDRDFPRLKKKLKGKYGTNPVTAVFWGVNSLGMPFVIIKSDRPVKQAKAEKPEDTTDTTQA